MSFVIAVLSVWSLVVQAEPSSLQRYNIHRSDITISGVSSGAFMATQMGVAYSKLFSAVASVAGGVYWCAQGESDRAEGECMKSARNIDPQVQIDYAKQLAAEGKIDALKNLRNQRIYIFASPRDMIIKPPSGEKLLDFAHEFYHPENIKFENTQNFAHGFATLDYGTLCLFGFHPWILNCGYDLAGEILVHAYGDLNPREERYPLENLLEFDQTEFADDRTPLYEKGWVYVPESCKNGQKCGLHVALHGCQMNPDFIKDKFAKNAGYNEWAEANSLIILYPQSAKVSGPNPYACWDWFGFTGADYVEKSGAQMQALRAMISRLTGK